MQPIRFTCWTCDSLRHITDELDGCCYECLLGMADAINSALISQLKRRLPVLIEKRNEFCDKVADIAIVSQSPAARAAAIDWRNYRARNKDESLPNTFEDGTDSDD
jgi:hypothetical protein